MCVQLCLTSFCPCNQTFVAENLRAVKTAKPVIPPPSQEIRLV